MFLTSGPVTNCTESVAVLRQMGHSVELLDEHLDRGLCRIRGLEKLRRSQTGERQAGHGKGKGAATEVAPGADQASSVEELIKQKAAKLQYLDGGQQ